MSDGFVRDAIVFAVIFAFTEIVFERLQVRLELFQQSFDGRRHVRGFNRRELGQIVLLQERIAEVVRQGGRGRRRLGRGGGRHVAGGGTKRRLAALSQDGKGACGMGR